MNRVCIMICCSLGMLLMLLFVQVWSLMLCVSISARMRYHTCTQILRLSDLSNFHGHNPLRTTHWDSLEKSLTVFILPPSSPFYKERNGQPIRRRLDLIFARPEVYWCAVVGWSGSIMFQRDLRQWAKDKW